MSIAPIRRRVKRCSVATGVVVAALFMHGGVGLAATSSVTSTSGAFTIVVPRGFRNDPAAYAGSAIKVEVLVAGSTENGFAVNINVVRERTGTASVGVVTQASISALKRIYRATHFSAVQDLTVAGAPARAVSYDASFTGVRRLHDRQVFVTHDGWAYIVTYSALPGSQYQGSLSALSEFLASWHWR